MFSTSIGGFLLSFLANILLAWTIGCLFIRTFFGKKYTGRVLHTLAWLIGVGIISHGLFNLQFLQAGIGIAQYGILLLIMLIAFSIKIFNKKESWKEYIQTRAIHIPTKEIHTSYKSSSLWSKIIAGLSLIITSITLITALIFTTHLPTYSDDSFGNRNKPIPHIIQEQGVKLFGEKEEILGKGNLGYPIHIPIYKALMAQIQGGYNDIYNNLFQRLIVFFTITFVIATTRTYTKDVTYTLLPAGVMLSLPLMFIHSVEGYMDLPLTCFTIIALRSLFQYFRKKDISYISMFFILSFILSNIKIDGLIIYFPALVIAGGAIALREGKVLTHSKKLLSDKKNLTITIASLVFFLLPFQIIKKINNLGFNPASLQGGEVLDQSIHREIFGQFGRIFFNQDNYGLALIIIAVIGTIAIHNIRKKKYSLSLLFLAPLVIFTLFTLVFLLTKNYQRVMDQTTVNRVYTMSFTVLFAFIGILLHEYKK